VRILKVQAWFRTTADFGLPDPLPMRETEQASNQCAIMLTPDRSAIQRGAGFRRFS
jgi:hypothetical protein